jgi:DMSO/TMAO reductase YedYZ molybdopterin-dependent catalytic subunit
VAVLASAGSTVPLLRSVSVFGVRSGDGPQGLPINKSARAAGVTASALAPSYALELVAGDRALSLSREDLLALPQTTAELPIACVEGWSASGTWTGVRVRELVAAVGGAQDADVVVRSLQESGPYIVTLLPANFVADDETLLALKLNGEDLAIDHGYPARIIAPNRPGVLQTKWVARLEVQA